MQAKTKISGLLAALWIALLVWPATIMGAGELADGTYTADYLILKAENDSVSMANDYWEKPATVTIKDGKATVRVTINHSFWVTQFKVPGGEGYVDTKVISSNKKTDTRLVEFAADVTKPIVSKIHVTVAEIDYDHDYTIRFVFDPDSFKLVKGAAPAATAKPTEQPAAAPTNKPAASVNPAASAEPTQGAQATTGQSATEGGMAATDKPADSATTKPTATPKPDGTASAEPSATALSAVDEAKASTAPSASTAAEQEAEAGDETGGEAVNAAGGEGEAEQQSQSGEAQLADADATEEEAAVPALAAGETAEAPVEESNGNGLIWWTPIAAVLILAVGAVYIWRRKVR